MGKQPQILPSTCCECLKLTLARGSPGHPQSASVPGVSLGVLQAACVCLAPRESLFILQLCIYSRVHLGKYMQPTNPVFPRYDCLKHNLIENASLFNQFREKQ